MLAWKPEYSINEVLMEGIPWLVIGVVGSWSVTGINSWLWNQSRTKPQIFGNQYFPSFGRALGNPELGRKHKIMDVQGTSGWGWQALEQELKDTLSIKVEEELPHGVEQLGKGALGYRQGGYMDLVIPLHSWAHLAVQGWQRLLSSKAVLQEKRFLRENQAND